MPNNIGPIAVDHTGFTVSSLDEAVRFWTEAIGFELVGKGELAGAFPGTVTGVPTPVLKAAIVKAPNGYLVELLEFASDKNEGRVPGSAGAIGATHFAITVSDIQHALKRVEAEGWKANGTPAMIPSGGYKGRTVVYVSGPDGIIIELMQNPT